MDANANSADPLPAGAVTREAMVQSALLSGAQAEEIGLPRDRIILSAKVSQVQDLIAVYRMLAVALRLRAALGPDGSRHGVERYCGLIRRHGHPAAGRHRRHSSGFAHTGAGWRSLAGSEGRAGTAADNGFRAFIPIVAACPGCGRTTSTVFQELARDIQIHLTESMPV
jgi:(E)-4-hydroxy-3-methylbut-2-enyl-diphosphate synthase